MATIMAFGNSEGTRRCDGSCHTARLPKCVCICGGRYHGKGDQAVELLQDDLLDGVWGKGFEAWVQGTLPGTEKK